MRIIDLFEATLMERHDHVVTALAKYEGDPDIYISFTEIPKLGINPDYEYDTPVGIYAYPLREVWTSLVNDTLPFASDRPYVHVFRAHGNIIDAADYTAADLTRDAETLRSRYADLVDPVVSLIPQWCWKQTARRLFGATVDIHDLEPEQRRKLVAETMRDYAQEAFATQVAIWSSEAYSKTAFGKFWNITRNLASLHARGRGEVFGTVYRYDGILNQMAKNAEKRDARTSVSWNLILRSLGYDGFSDKRGKKIIHENEPFQAVFLTPRAVRPIEMLKNIRKFHGEAIRFATLDEINKILQKARGVKYGLRLNVMTKNDTMRTAGYLSKEWLDLFVKGHSTHLEISNVEFFYQNISPYWHQFVQLLLDIDYSSNLPKLVNEMILNDRLHDANFVTELLDAAEPTKAAQVTIFYHNVLNPKFLQLLGASETEEMIVRHILRSTIPFIRRDPKRLFDNLRHVLGDRWWTVVRLIPEVELRKMTNGGD